MQNFLDSFIADSGLLSKIQGQFNPQGSAQAQQPPAVQGTPATPLLPLPLQQPKKRQGGGMDIGTIMKIASMFGGM